MKKKPESKIRKFVFATDLHYGYENDPVAGHRRRIHDRRAASVFLQFCKDFQPDEIVIGGDWLDCHPISPHNRDRPGVTEGLRFRDDCRGCRVEYLEPLEAIEGAKLTYIIGNHEAWISQFVEKHPTLAGILDLRTLLRLDDRWNVVPQGKSYSLGRLMFVHGDQLTGGDVGLAKQSVIAYEKSIRFGHVHTFMAYTKTGVGDDEPGKTGMAVPCLARKSPAYSKGRPNRWCNGFLYGYLRPGGAFSDYPVIIIRGEATINGVTYKGR